MEKPKNNIIGLAGKMNSGKGALAKWLNETYGYVILESADKLKETCTDILGLDSVDTLNRLKKSNQKIGMYFNDELCERFSDAFGVDKSFVDDVFLSTDVQNVRELLQKMGTDVLRKYNPDWHINHLCLKIIENIRNEQPVVIGDVRFPNEKARIEGLGGVVYYIDRDTEEGEHISEHSLSPSDFSKDNVIHNDGTIEELIEGFKTKIMR